MAVYKPHYNRPEKESFYRWLLCHQQLNENTAQRHVKILTNVERYTKNYGFNSKKVFSDDIREACLTIKEFLEDSGFKEFCKKYSANQVTAEDALIAFMRYEMSRVRTKDSDAEWLENSVLYVHRGTIFCQKEDHNIIPATAVLLGKSGQDVRLSVSYCQDCKLFFIDEESYKRYRKKYGILIGDIRFVKDGKVYIGENFLADESPLMLCGYSVSQQVGLSESERHFIISKIIEQGILTKLQVARYLGFFIRRNGQKDSNYLALSKWERDLDFTLHYDENKQKEYLIRSIQKYNGRLKVKK